MFMLMMMLVTMIITRILSLCQHDRLGRILLQRAAVHPAPVRRKNR
jgi:hypothetical protein